MLEIVLTIVYRKTEWDDVLKDKGLLVLDCFATWCGPCKMIAPKVVEYVLPASPRSRLSHYPILT
jgi:thiol-disulfide isomerase/thioredoxin